MENAACRIGERRWRRYATEMIQKTWRRLALSASALCGLAASALATESEVTRIAEPIGMIAATTDDYPDESLRKNEQGMTTVAYEINEAGRVTPGSCVVKATSDYPRLDRRTCEVVERRFRFKPALQDGKPVREWRTQSVLWQIPGVRDKERFVDEAIRKVNFYGRCLVEARPDLARRIVDMPLGAPEQIAAVTAIDGKALKCLGSDTELKFTPVALVGPLAEWLFQKRFGTSLPSVSTSVAPLPARNASEVLGQCVVRRNPANSLALIATIPTGSDEAAAIKRIVPDLGPCVTAGTTLQLNRMTIRNLVATALYRDTAHALDTAAGQRP